MLFCLLASISGILLRFDLCLFRFIMLHVVDIVLDDLLIVKIHIENYCWLQEKFQISKSNEVFILLLFLLLLFYCSLRKYRVLNDLMWTVKLCKT